MDQKNNLKDFFKYLDSNLSSRIAAQLIVALKDAEDLEQLDSNWAVKQNVAESVKFLRQVTTHE